jgi:hypothetical protein
MPGSRVIIQQYRICVAAALLSSVGSCATARFAGFFLASAALLNNYHFWVMRDFVFGLIAPYNQKVGVLFRPIKESKGGTCSYPGFF